MDEIDEPPTVPFTWTTGDALTAGAYRFVLPQDSCDFTPYRPDPARTAAILAGAASWYGASLGPEHTPGLTEPDRVWVRDMLRPSTER